MSGIPEYSSSPHEDPDELCFAGRCAARSWLSKIDPFQRVRLIYPEWEHERIGKEMTAHVDAEARERVSARRKADRRAYWDAFGARLQRLMDESRDMADATPDHVATGW
ncbi:hypothetical protein WMF38_57630 [Sorangium sp. So ce118]